MLVGAADEDVRLRVELPVIVLLEAVEDDRMEPCNIVTLVDVGCIEVDEAYEALASTSVVWKIAVVPLRVEVVVYER